MKLLMILGAILGFGIGFFFSLLEEGPWPAVLLHAGVGAYFSGLLLRWWGQLWEKNLRLALIEKEATGSDPSTHPSNSSNP